MVVGQLKRSDFLLSAAFQHSNLSHVKKQMISIHWNLTGLLIWNRNWDFTRTKHSPPRHHIQYWYNQRKTWEKGASKIQYTATNSSVTYCGWEKWSKNKQNSCGSKAGERTDEVTHTKSFLKEQQSVIKVKLLSSQPMVRLHQSQTESSHTNVQI